MEDWAWKALAIFLPIAAAIVIVGLRIWKAFDPNWRERVRKKMEKVDGIEKDIEHLKTNCPLGHDVKIARMEGAMGGLKEDTGEIKAELVQVRGQIGTLSREVSGLSGEITVLSGQFEVFIVELKKRNGSD